MTHADLFAPPTPGLFGACQLAVVVSVQDPDSMARVQVRLLSADGVSDHDAPLWARVAAPFAGNNRGAMMLPDVGDEVLLAFVQGDARAPIVLGGLWSGSAAPPDAFAGDRVDRWVTVGKAGTRVAIIEESAGQEQIVLETPNGVKAELTDAGGGKVTIDCAGTTVTIDSGGVSIQTSGKLSAQASQVEISAGMVKVDAGMSKFSGVVKCDVLQATTVIATTYTPGAGNIW